VWMHSAADSSPDPVPDVQQRRRAKSNWLAVGGVLFAVVAIVALSGNENSEGFDSTALESGSLPGADDSPALAFQSRTAETTLTQLSLPELSIPEISLPDLEKIPQITDAVEDIEAAKHPILSAASHLGNQALGMAQEPPPQKQNTKKQNAKTLPAHVGQASTEIANQAQQTLSPQAVKQYAKVARQQALRHYARAAQIKIRRAKQIARGAELQMQRNMAELKHQVDARVAKLEAPINNEGVHTGSPPPKMLYHTASTVAKTAIAVANKVAQHYEGEVGKIKRMKEHYKQTLADNSKRLKKAVENVDKDSAGKIQQIKKQYKQALAHRVKDNAGKIQQIKKHYKQALAHRVKDSAGKIQQIKKQYKQALAHRVKDSAGKIQQIKKQYKQALAHKVKDSAGKIQQIKKQYKQALAHKVNVVTKTFKKAVEKANQKAIVIQNQHDQQVFAKLTEVTDKATKTVSEAKQKALVIEKKAAADVANANSATTHAVSDADKAKSALASNKAQVNEAVHQASMYANKRAASAQVAALEATNAKLKAKLQTETQAESRILGTNKALKEKVADLTAAASARKIAMWKAKAKKAMKLAAAKAQFEQDAKQLKTEDREQADQKAKRLKEKSHTLKKQYKKMRKAKAENLESQIEQLKKTASADQTSKVKAEEGKLKAEEGKLKAEKDMITSLTAAAKKSVAAATQKAKAQVNLAKEAAKKVVTAAKLAAAKQKAAPAPSPSPLVSTPDDATATKIADEIKAAENAVVPTATTGDSEGRKLAEAEDALKASVHGLHVANNVPGLLFQEADDEIDVR